MQLASMDASLDMIDPIRYLLLLEIRNATRGLDDIPRQHPLEVVLVSLSDPSSARAHVPNEAWASFAHRSREERKK